jgi:hypothetical protein
MSSQRQAKNLWKRITTDQDNFLDSPSRARAREAIESLENWLSNKTFQRAYMETAKRRIRIYQSYINGGIAEGDACRLIRGNLSLPKTSQDSETFENYFGEEYPAPLDEHHGECTGHIEEYELVEFDE